MLIVAPSIYEELHLGTSPYAGIFTECFVIVKIDSPTTLPVSSATIKHSNSIT
jgi:hypothetical protein